MDPNQLKATYDQTQFLSAGITATDRDLLKVESHLQKSYNDHSQYLSDNVAGVDKDLFSSQNAQTQYLSDKVYNVNSDLLKSQNEQNIAGINSQNAQTRYLSDGLERSQYANENRQNRNFAMAQADIKDQGASTRDTVYRQTGNTDVNVKEQGALNRDTVYRTAANTDAYVKDSGADTREAIYRQTSALDANIYRTTAALDVGNYRTSSDIRADSANHFQNIRDVLSSQSIESGKATNELIGYMKDQSDHNWSNFANGSKEIYANRAEIHKGTAETILSTTNQFGLLAKQASDNTMQIQMEALKNKAELSKQMALEYGYLKDKINCSEASIKGLLQVQEADRLRDVIRATENKSLYFELKDQHHGHGGRRRRH